MRKKGRRSLRRTFEVFPDTVGIKVSNNQIVPSPLTPGRYSIDATCEALYKVRLRHQVSLGFTGRPDDDKMLVAYVLKPEGIPAFYVRQPALRPLAEEAVPTHITMVLGVLVQLELKRLFGRVPRLDGDFFEPLDRAGEAERHAFIDTMNAKLQDSLEFSDPGLLDSIACSFPPRRDPPR